MDIRIILILSAGDKPGLPTNGPHGCTENRLHGHPAVRHTGKVLKRETYHEFQYLKAELVLSMRVTLSQRMPC